jgi:hypothetical protein
VHVINNQLLFVISQPIDRLLETARALGARDDWV